MAWRPTRSTRPEIMDERRLTPQEARRFWRFLRFANRRLGGTRVVRRHLAPLAQPGAHLRLLDLATGDADIPEAIARWASRRGARVRWVGVDIAPEALAFARGRGVLLVRADARRLPFRAAAFDAATASLVFHHLGDDAAVRVLRELARVARRVIVNDLVRRWRAWFWTTLIAALLGDEVTRVDGPRSVERAFRREEILEVARRAGVVAAYHDHFGHRFALVAQAPTE